MLTVAEVLRVLDALQSDERCPCNRKKGDLSARVGPLHDRRAIDGRGVPPAVVRTSRLAIASTFRCDSSWPMHVS